MLVVPPEESFNGLTQLIFGLEAGSVEGLALQQAEHDFNLVQPTGRSRREVKLYSPLELRRFTDEGNSCRGSCAGGCASD